jgi:hypothetical protein
MENKKLAHNAPWPARLLTEETFINSHGDKQAVNPKNDGLGSCRPVP